MSDEKKKSGCLICGSELVYHNNPVEYKCYYCNEKHEAHESCERGHYVCNKCHANDAYELIHKFCNSTKENNPLAMAVTLMKHPSVKMHGPEHHFLVVAVMLVAYQMATGKLQSLDTALATAKKRAKDVKGGFCGFHGACGAAVGTGIFISIVTSATPLSDAEFSLSNKMTSRSLFRIAENGGPRCCKRESFLAIEEAVKFLDNEFGVKVPGSFVGKCEFSVYNKECKHSDCRYYNLID